MLNGLILSVKPGNIKPMNTSCQGNRIIKAIAPGEDANIQSHPVGKELVYEEKYQNLIIKNRNYIL